MIFLKKITKYSPHHSLSAYTGFKSLAFILLRYCICKIATSNFKIFKGRYLKKKSYDFFFKFHHIIYSLYSISCKKFLASYTYTFRDNAFAMSKLSKKGNNSNIIKTFFSKISPNTSLIIPFQLTQVKFLSLTLFEIRHLQIFISIFSKGRNFTRGDNSKKKISVCYFSMRNPYMKFQDDISFRNIIVAKFQGPKF